MRVRHRRGAETLLFLGASVSQLPSIRHARRRGFRVVTVDGDPRAVALRYADVAETVDFTDVERVVELGARHGAAGVLAISSDRAVVPAAAVAAALGLPGIGVEVATAMTDKATMRERLAAAGVSQPRHRVLTAPAEAEVAFAAVGAPAVLKPVDSGGQRGVFRIERADDIARHLPDALALSRSGRAMLEEYVDGTELNGLFVVRDGSPTLVTLSDRLRPPGAGFGVGWIHSFPSRLPAVALASAEETAAAAIRTLGLRDGIAFPQLIVSDDGTPRLIEVAARIAAGQMADLVRFAVGIDLFDVAFAQALGRPVADELVQHRFVRPIAIRFLTAEPGVLPVGSVTGVSGLRAVRRSAGVLAAGLYFGAGDTIEAVRVDADRNGYVVATAESAAAALERADAAAAKLVVRTAEGGAQRSPLRRRPLLAALAALVILAVLGGVIARDHGGVRSALVVGTRATIPLAPSCGCTHDVARIAFRLVRGARVTIEMLNAQGRPIKAIVRDRLLPTGWRSVAWNGRTGSGRVVSRGVYRPVIDFLALHRTIDLPDRVIVTGAHPRPRTRT